MNNKAKMKKEMRKEKRELYKFFKGKSEDICGKPKGIKQWIIFRIKWLCFWKIQKKVLEAYLNKKNNNA